MGPKVNKKSDSKSGGKAEKPKVKRAPPPYIIFCSEKRPEIKISHPDATFGETGRLLGQMWAALGEKGKEPYVKESARKKAALAAEGAED